MGKIKYISLTAIVAVLIWSCSPGEGGGSSVEGIDSAAINAMIDSILGEKYKPNSMISFVMENQKQRIVVPPLPESAEFAGERVPLEYIDVRESLIRELTAISYMHSSLIYTMQLSGRYKERICRNLKANGVPEDFFYLCVAESMLQPLTSSAAAAGYWQFLKGTGKEYGLVINNEIDQRYDWEASTAAACRYMQKAYSKYGSWTLAAASYNIGIKNIDNRIKLQGTRNYYDMQLPMETARYVFRAIAYKTIMNNPQAYGFDIKESDIFSEPEHRMVQVGGKVENWSNFAKANGTNFKMLKQYNEWIRSNKYSGNLRKSFNVFIPERETVQNSEQ